MDRALLGDDPAFLLRGLPLMALHHADAAHQRPLPIGTHLDHLTGAAFVAAGKNHHLVALADLCGHHSTSGASAMILSGFLGGTWTGEGAASSWHTGSN